MWQHLQLSELGVIESAELDLGAGFTVITGETGAGKTMVVTALGLLRGERADLGLVRRGSDQARVEATVALPAGSGVADRVEDAGGRVEDDTLVIGRVLSSQGRSRAVAGGATVPAGLLAEVTDELVAVHGQSDQHRLLRAAEQRAALDRFAGQELATLMSEYSSVYARWRDTQRQLDDLTARAQERARELDLLRFGLDEVSAVEPVAGEDEHLQAEEGRLAHAEALAMAAERARLLLAADTDDAGSAARGQIAAAVAALHEVAGHDAALDALATRAHELTILLDDVAAELSAYSDAVELDPARLAAVQERRAQLVALQRKYGPGLDDVLAWAQKSASRLAELDHDDEYIAQLVAERDQLEPRVIALADQMTAVRTAAAGRLAVAVDAELSDLSMPHAHLEPRITRLDGAAPAAHGLDDVELLFSANQGMDPRPLARGASGGELSRLMLALEVVLADRTTIPTLVFDEVDAGIGGKAAVEVGRRLRRLAEHAQVIAVTHLPQVAAFAHHHFVVDKAHGTVTRSSVVRLDDDDRVDELARMLAGQDDSASAQAHARELLDLAHGS